MKNQFRYLFICCFTLMIFNACAATKPESFVSGNTGELVSQLEANLATAKSNQVNVLAPGLFNDAQSAFMKAKQGLDKGIKLTDIQEYVSQGSASLKKAEEIAEVSRTILGETNKARDKALKVGADKLGDPYMMVENQYLTLSKAIENDNMSYAQKNASEVQAAFRNLEIMAIKNSAIGKARQMMADAEKANVPKTAPTAYKDALQALMDADAYIGQNPYAADTISQKAAHAEFMARRMISINESGNTFKGMTPESSALYMESVFVRLGKTLNTGDLRDKNIDAQLSAITGTVETLGQKNQSFKKDNQAYHGTVETLGQKNQSIEKDNQAYQTHIATLEQKNHSFEKDNQAYQARIATLEQQLSGLKGYSREQEAAKGKLAAESKFNEKFNKVQGFFQPDEAEVYKQGGQMVIRMRGIQFPVGKATLTPENYTLLGKVQQAIGTFGQPTVIIEGHTDSTGSAQMNQALSQKRAEAVKTYLVANKTLPANLITATGYGPSRPLAPETTPEGRAMNRRIDVLFTPSQAQ